LLPHFPSATPKYPPPSITSSLLFIGVAEMGATGAASGRLEVQLFLPERRGGKSQFVTILLSAVLGIL